MVRSFLTALVALAASVSFAGPVRLATNFFIPSGRTNPIVLDARTDASGNLVTAAQVDSAGGGKQIVITKFTSAGVRRWSNTINTPLPVTPAGQVAGKFQILLDGVGNTYVVSPRAGNPAVAGTTQDLLVRKISDTGATIGYLSLVGYLFETTGRKFDVTNAQMQNGPSFPAEVGLAFTAVSRDNGTSSAYLLRFLGGVSGGAIAMNGSYVFEGQIFPLGVGYYSRFDFAVVSLKEASVNANPAGSPKYRLVLLSDNDIYLPFTQERTNTLEPYVIFFDIHNNASVDPEGFPLSSRLGLQAEGFASSLDQAIVFDRDPSGVYAVTRLAKHPAISEYVGSATPVSATRVGSDWLAYSYYGEESLFKFPSEGELTSTAYPISLDSALNYVGTSITSARGRAFLAGGPMVGGVQGIFSSFNSEGELVYAAGQNQPFGLFTSLVVPAANNRFWTVGTTSTGLQAVILWQEPEYFVGISSAKSAEAGDTVTVKAHLNSPAPTGGYRFNVSVSSNLQNAPRTVTVPAGDSSATFTVKVKSTATPGLATVTARTNSTLDINTAHTATLTVQ